MNSNSNATDSAEQQRSRRPLVVAVIAVIASIAFIVSQNWPRGEALPTGVSASEFQSAQRALEIEYGTAPTTDQVLLELGRQKFQQEDFSAAEQLLRQIPEDKTTTSLSAATILGEVLLKTNQATEAERALRRVMDSADDVSRANLGTASEWLTYLLSVQLRFIDRRDHLRKMQSAGVTTLNDLKQLYFPHLLIWRSAVGRQKLKEWLDADPENVKLQLAYARYLTAEGQTESASAIFENVMSQSKDGTDSQSTKLAVAGIAECLYEDGDDELADWLNQHPYVPEEHWLLTQHRGFSALDNGQPKDAQRWLELVRKQFPSNPECHMKLAMAARRLGDDQVGDKYEQQSLLLAEMRVDMPKLRENAAARPALRTFIQRCQTAGFDDAAQAFQNHLEQMSAD